MLHSHNADFMDEESVSVSQFVKGHRLVEVPGLEDRASTAPEPMRPPYPRGMADYITSPHKHEFAIFKQRRHTKQAHRFLASLDPVRSALMRASAGQCGLDFSCCSVSKVETLLSLDRPGSGNGDEASEGVLFCVAALYCFGLSYQYAKLEFSVLPEVCSWCNALLGDQALRGSRTDKIFA